MRKTIIKNIGPYEDILATVKRRKLKWYGHVTRSDGLTKVILQGTFEGSRRRGRPKKSWIDNIAEWTGKSFAETQAMAHNRQEWRELMRKSVMTAPTALRGAKGPRQGKAWCGGPIRMMNIQEVDEQELCRQIFQYVGVMSKDCILRMQGYRWLWQ